jgi:hypothetical protein
MIFQFSRLSQPDGLVILVLVLLLPSAAQSFVFSEFSLGPITTRTAFRKPFSFPRHVLRSNQAEQEETETNQLESYERDARSSRQISRTREYWLDLREAAILPSEALQFLEQNLFESDDSQENGEENHSLFNILSRVDRVLLSEDLFYRALSDSNFPDIELLYTPSDGNNELVANDKDLKQSIPIGKVISCDYNEVIDPLLSLETTRDGGWLFVDGDISKEKEAVDWLEKEVSGLVAFLISVTPSTDISLHSGLWIPTLSSTSNTPGGLAVSCRNKSALLQNNAALEQSMGTTMITTSTDSGILLPTGMPDNRSCEHLRTALVLPFDVVLWETVLDLQDLEENT